MLQVHVQNMKCLWLLHSNNCYGNAPQCYVYRDVVHFVIYVCRLLHWPVAYCYVTVILYPTLW